MSINCNDLPIISMTQCTDKKLLCGILTICPSSPPIKTVICCNITNTIIEVVKSDNAIIIIGRLCLKVEYAADVPCKDDPVHFCNFVINYGHLICFKKKYTLPTHFSNNDIKVKINYERIEEISPFDVNYLILLDFTILKNAIYPY